MAFWGIEVKPGKPFTHSFDGQRGRLHISQATLGIGAASKKSLVQCNVGNKSPVLLCCLLPDKTESCTLSLEFEEVEEVIFSVIGPRSVHLTGYYLGNGRHSNFNEDSESYGEDIADTETEKSNDHGEEDDYEDSFIDDGELEVFPSSPVSSDGVLLEEKLDGKKTNNGKSSHRRLKKKYQLSESDDDISLQQNIAKGSAGVLVLESDSEDKIPISSLYKSKTIEKNAKLEEEEEEEEKKAGNGIGGERGHNKLEDGKGHKDTEEKENAGTEKDGNHSIGSKRKNNAVGIGAGPERQSDLPIGSVLHSTELGPENGGKSKKKRKDRSKGVKHLEVDSVNHKNDLKEDKAPQNENKADNMDQNLPERKENQRPNSYKSCDTKVDQLAGDNQSEEKKIKRKRKKSKTQENEGVANMEVPPLSMNEKSGSHLEVKDRNSDANSSQVRMMSNGLVIEELITGKPDGKIACQGKKVSVYYTGKLKDSGQIFDSNIGRAPLKFRLGAGKVIKGWDVGLDGMRVGDKRRLVIPPSMGYGNEGAGDNIPPNSWLVFDVELAGAR